MRSFCCKNFKMTTFEITNVNVRIRIPYLSYSLFSPPKAMTVLIELKTSSAMLPALAYADCSLLVRFPITCKHIECYFDMKRLKKLCAWYVSLDCSVVSHLSSCFHETHLRFLHKSQIVNIIQPSKMRFQPHTTAPQFAIILYMPTSDYKSGPLTVYKWKKRILSMISDIEMFVKHISTFCSFPTFKLANCNRAETLCPSTSHNFKSL